MKIWKLVNDNIIRVDGNDNCVGCIFLTDGYNGCIAPEIISNICAEEKYEGSGSLPPVTRVLPTPKLKSTEKECEWTIEHLHNSNMLFKDIYICYTECGNKHTQFTKTKYCEYCGGKIVEKI